MNNRDQENFSEAVKMRRKAQSISQVDLANAAGLGQATVSRVERQAFDPTLSSAKAIANGLGLPLSCMLPDEPGDPRIYEAMRLIADGQRLKAAGLLSAVVADLLT